ncbi:DarT ssDNA thymidine ADP-ribosyltransferase family protein [Caldifermentibacillus hisashii]|uniref:DarT ssDNA thymidine ADP-ribosyltransferase family protein n=1 Tax=Caldifermentibacillus hisashii TaxID=996558 RepID=UPI003136291E
MTVDILEPSEIINNSTPFLNGVPKKLTKYAFHFTDVNNAANILNHGKILSRNKALLKGVMINDNASREVITGTNEYVHDYVRFYFRPKTPTQYHNEGIRARDEIHPELQAHCPIPVFFLFDINKLLKKTNTYFSHESLASHYEVPIYNYLNSYEEFTNAPFYHIYHYNSIPYEMPFEDRQAIVKRRQAEIIVKDECDLVDLKRIYCRNINELETLKALLTPSVSEKYNDIIKVPKNPSCFFNNDYLQVRKVFFKDRQLFIKWKTNGRNNTLFNFRFKITEIDSEKEICNGKEFNYNPYNHNQQRIFWKTKAFLNDYSIVNLEIFLDNNLIYKKHHELDADLISEICGLSY